jgi:hypothetical protein
MLYKWKLQYIDGNYNSKDMQIFVHIIEMASFLFKVLQPRSVLKMLNAQTKHSGHFCRKILSNHSLSEVVIVIVVRLLDLVTSSTKV